MDVQHPIDTPKPAFHKKKRRRPKSANPAANTPPRPENSGSEANPIKTNAPAAPSSANQSPAPQKPRQQNQPRRPKPRPKPPQDAAAPNSAAPNNPPKPNPQAKNNQPSNAASDSPRPERKEGQNQPRRDRRRRPNRRPERPQAEAQILPPMTDEIPTESTDLNDTLPEAAEADLSTGQTSASTQTEDPAPDVEKVEIIGIRFKTAGKTYYFSPNGILFAVGENAIAETARGIEYGKVTIANRMIPVTSVVGTLKSVLRKSTREDDEKHQSNRRMRDEAFEVCLKKIREHGLSMKLVDVEYTFDNNKLMFYFTADGRVDFRELVKDLASVYKTRIELRQIGIRDETKIRGGLSVCGRPFCCSSFLNDFAQVSIKMAKEQGLSINSSKISGACGRLMCCLKYEHETYEYESSLTPRVSSIVETPGGQGVVVDRQVLAGLVKVRLNHVTDNSTEVYPRAKVKVIGFVQRDDD